MGRTVVLHPGALGDVLLAVPALRTLRASAPPGELTLAAQPHVGGLLQALGVVDRSVPFDTLGLETLFTDADASARLRALVAGARVVSWFGAGDATFGRRLRALAPGAVIASSRPTSATSVWRGLLAAVGDARGDVCAPIAVPSELAATGRGLLAAAGWTGERRLVMLHPGAGGADKRWSPEGFAAVVERLAGAGLATIVHDGPADHAAVTALADRLSVPALTLTDPPLPALAGALAHVALWVGNDSGVTHLAAAVGTPTVALFASANLAWRPWAARAQALVVAMDALARRDVDDVLATIQ